MTPSFKAGLKAGSTLVPTFIAIFTAVGIAAQVQGVSFFASLWMTVLMYSAPAQFAMMDVAAQGGIWVQAALVGILVNLRFFIMSMSLSTLFRGVSRSRLALWAQFVSASSYLLTFFRSRKDADTDMFAFFRGVVWMTFSTAVIGTLIGVLLGVGMPALFNFGAALFLPLYFALLLVSENMNRAEIHATLIGLVATPVLEVLLPGWGLIIAALAAGSLVTGIEQ